MSEPQKSILDRVVEYVPFQQREVIKLSVGMIQKLFCRPTRSGALCTEDDALKFIMLCKSRALNPFEGDAYIVGFDEKDGARFNLITAHQAFMKRAEAHPSFDGMDSGVIVKRNGELLSLEGDFFVEGDTLLGGWATVYRQGWGHPTKARIRLESFNKGRSRWETDPAGMIVKCAEADALRRTFPNQLGGLYSETELGGFLPAIGAEPAKAAAPVGRLEVRKVQTAPAWVADQNNAVGEDYVVKAPAPVKARRTQDPASCEPVGAEEKVIVDGTPYVKRGREWINELDPAYKASEDTMQRWRGQGKVIAAEPAGIGGLGTGGQDTGADALGF